MAEIENAELELLVSIEDATTDELDRATRQLLSELRELRVDSVELTRGSAAPDGSKGDPVTVGSIALELLPAVLPTVVGLIQAWTTRGQGRNVKFRGRVGKEMVEFEGSPEDLQKLIDKLGKGVNSKK